MPNGTPAQPSLRTSTSHEVLKKKHLAAVPSFPATKQCRSKWEIALECTHPKVGVGARVEVGLVTAVGSVLALLLAAGLIARELVPARLATPNCRAAAVALRTCWSLQRGQTPRLEHDSLACWILQRFPWQQGRVALQLR